jgi:hypothetical protein
LNRRFDSSKYINLYVEKIDRFSLFIFASQSRRFVGKCIWLSYNQATKFALVCIFTYSLKTKNARYFRYVIIFMLIILFWYIKSLNKLDTLTIMQQSLPLSGTVFLLKVTFLNSCTYSAQLI